MTDNGKPAGPILRLFEVTAKPGQATVLLEKFRSTSAQVVQGQPGNLGYFFGSVVPGTAGDTVIFASIWSDMAAIMTRFGADWESAYLPPGYDDLIEACSVRHIDMTGGWHPASS